MTLSKKSFLISIGEMLPKFQRRMPKPIRNMPLWKRCEDALYMHGLLSGGNAGVLWKSHHNSRCPADWYDFAAQVFPAHQQKVEILDFLDLAKKREPRVVMEIGTARSGTQFLLGQVLDSVELIIALDLEVRNVQLLRMFTRSNLKRICLEGSSYGPSTFDRVQQALGGRLIDILFIDGDHAYEGVSADYSIYHPLVRKGGLIAFHDIVPDHQTRYGKPSSGWAGGVPLFWSELKAHSHYHRFYEFIANPEQDGMGIGVMEA